MLRNLWALRLQFHVHPRTIHRVRFPSSASCATNTSRTMSNDSRDPRDTPNKKRSLPALMEFPEIIWPTVFKSMRNWIFINFIIRPYIDREFSMPDFVLGAKQALQAVSTKLSDGETTELKDLLSKECLSEITTSIRKMTVAERHEIRVIKDDVYFSFPYQVGIIFDDTTSEAAQKRWVEITMIFHALRGLRDMQERGETPPINLGMMPEYRDKISICNYRFIKEFTKGQESDWTINIVNHFKPNDLLEE